MPRTYREDGPQPLYPNLYGQKAYFYKDPNPRWIEILAGARVHNIVSEWTAKIATSYVERVGSRSDPTDPQSLAGSVRAEVFMGGYRGDRWIGQIVVGVVYASADEFGRHDPAVGQNDSTYEGSGDLRGALYAHLPAI